MCPQRYLYATVLAIKKNRSNFSDSFAGFGVVGVNIIVTRVNYSTWLTTT